ncbi:cation:proton antiporter [Amycolatopsis nigrescens]|uniref:cation:proton antiporter n=1 Tax=Amycolatopsis nigrescens TaxID=381445 RepID=UPI0003750EDC|nr:cation:proton antiporter [Amycolatopsis nigrescens]
MSDIAVLLAALAVLLSLARLSGSAVARLGQPAVIGEIACGLLIGIALSTGPDLPVQTGVTLDAIAQLGLTLFLFCVGARLAPSITDRCVKSAVVPALGAAVVPFILGALLALWLARRHAPAGTTAFVLFAAAAMSVTAFPVLARILAERGMLDDDGGQRALSAAALTDAAAWTMLAFVAASPLGETRAWSLVMIVPILAGLLAVARPRFGHWVASLSRPAATTLMVALACAGAAATDAIGLHSALGAFLAGAAIGRSAPKVDPAALVAPLGSLLVPLYFVLVGRKIDLGEFDLVLVLETVAVVVVAVAGKCGGGYLGARFAGQPPHSAAVFAALMNTRGVTELVFLSIGLGLGVIDSAFYTAMVAMALVTTAMTGPLLNLLRQPNEVH